MEALKPITDRDVASKFRGAIESTHEVVTTRLTLWEEQAKTVGHLSLVAVPWILGAQSVFTALLVVATLTAQVFLLELVGKTASWLISTGALSLICVLAMLRVKNLYSDIKHALKPEEAV